MLKSTLLTCLTFLCFVLPAAAKDALTPAEAPKIFMESVYKFNYKTAWKILNKSTQAHFVETVLKMEKNNTLSKAQIENYFNTSDRALKKGFWTQFRRSMDCLLYTSPSPRD